MKIFVNAEENAYTDWCACLVAKLFATNHISFNGKEIDTVIINDADDKRIYLSIFNLPFVVRIWICICCEEDCDEDICYEQVGYTLFFAAEDASSESGFTSENGNPMCGGFIKMCCDCGATGYVDEDDEEEYEDEIVELNEDME